MNIRPSLAAAALLLTPAGCHAASSGPAAAPNTAPATAPATGKPSQAALIASIPQRSSVPFHFAVSGGDDEMTGVIDGRHNAGEFDMVNDYPAAGYSLDIDLLVLDRKAWVKLAYKKPRKGHTLPKQWLTLNYDKALRLNGGGPFDFGQENDPGLVTQVFVYAQNVRAAGPGQISGTTDMTSMTGATFLGRDHFAALGSGARAVPFTAVLDGAGRLSSLSVQVPAGGKFAATTYHVAYTGYGSTARPEPPAAGDQIPAPDSTYELFRDAQYAGPDVG
ncbi:hypothetical protein [Actinoplanes sp. NPDC051411]|uniref:hypothetical protein n=1 Tax=Actinoplanes sp. NPDC051411 TaxID=3155522 RepID=UPI003414E42B